MENKEDKHEVPKAIKDNLAKREEAVKALGKRQFTQGQPGLTYDRVDGEFAAENHMSLIAWRLRMELIQLRVEKKMWDLKDADVLKILEERLEGLPSEMEIAMMPDPGDWGREAKIRRDYCKTLISDAKLRGAYASGDDAVYAQLDKHGQAAYPPRSIPGFGPGGPGPMGPH